MTRLRTLAPGAFAAIVLAGTTAVAGAGDAIEGTPITMTTSHCAAFGPGFVDMGNGTCARIENHVRVELGMRRTAIPSWGGAASSSAELRSEGDETMPGVGTSHQLRVRNGLQSFDHY